MLPAGSTIGRSPYAQTADGILIAPAFTGAEKHAIAIGGVLYDATDGQVLKQVIDSGPGYCAGVDIIGAPQTSRNTSRPNGTSGGVVGIDEDSAGTTAHIVWAAFFPIDGQNAGFLEHLAALTFGNLHSAHHALVRDGAQLWVDHHLKILIKTISNTTPFGAFFLFTVGFCRRPGEHHCDGQSQECRQEEQNLAYSFIFHDYCIIGSETIAASFGPSGHQFPFVGQ